MQIPTDDTRTVVCSPKCFSPWVFSKSKRNYCSNTTIVCFLLSLPFQPDSAGVHTAGESNMADFVSKSVVKSAERELATPLAGKAVLNTIVGNILADNPWGCTPYTSGGETFPAVAKSSEYYSGTVIYENNDGKQVGRISVRSPASGAFDTIIATILADNTIETAMGGTPSHDSSEDGYSITLKCHAANGELYNVTFKRDKVSISSYESDSILTTVETWADTVSELA